MGQPDYEAELIAVAQPFWNAEAEITRRFFAGKPSREHYLRYLKAAVYKELNPVIGYGPTTGYANGLHMEFATLVGRFDGLDRDVARSRRTIRRSCARTARSTTCGTAMSNRAIPASRR